MPLPRSPHRWAWLAAAACLLAMAAPWIGILASERRILWCENPQIANLTSILLSHLLAGEIPLWTFFQNAGQPLWPILEAHFPSYDPLVLFLGLPLGALGLGADVIHTLTLGGVSALFLVGVFRLAREEGLETPYALFCVLAVAGGINHGLMRNPYLVLHAHYAPFLILAMRRLHLEPSLRSASWLGIMIVVNLSGANTLYLLAFLAVLAACRLALDRSLPRIPPLALSLLAAGIVAAGSIPFLLTGWHLTRETHLASRAAAPYLWSPPLFHHLELFTWLPQGKDWIGSATAGLLGGVLAVAAGAAALCARVKPAGDPDRQALLKLRFWTIAWVALAFLTFNRGVADLGSRHLSMRNFGFLLPYLAIALSFTAAFSLRWLSLKAPSLLADRRFWLCAAAALLPLTAFYTHFPLSRKLLSVMDPGKRSHLLLQWALLFLQAAGILAGTMGLLHRFRAPLSERPRLLAHLFLLLSAANFACFALGSRFPYGFECLAPNAKRAPVPRELKDVPQFQRRSWEPDLTACGPFINEAPAVFRVPSAVFPVSVDATSYGHPDPLGTHLIHPKRFHALTTAGLPDALLRGILGVDRDAAWLVPKAIAASDPDGALSLLSRAPPGALDAAVVVESAEPGEPVWPSRTGPAPGPVRRTLLSTTALRLEGDAPEAGWVVVSEGFDPSWRAWRNGTPVGILPAHAAVMAVPVEKGPFSIELRYRPWLYLAGWWIRLAIHAMAAVVAVRAAGRWLLRRG